VVDPSIDDKLRLVELANALGIDCMDIGLPGAGKRAVEDCTVIAELIKEQRLAVKPACAARTHQHDVQAIVDISQKVGVEIEVLCFIGSSPIRQYAEDWDLARMLKLSADAIDLARRYDLPVGYVTEDTTRSRPDVLHKLFTNAVEHGAQRLVVCDTVGHATPDGIKNLLRFTRNLLDGMGRSDVGIDWHGHNDRGLGVVNSIFALEYGADRVHGTALGIGERVGNAALDQILLNLKLLGELPDRDLSKLLLWCKTASAATHVPIHPQYPLAGSDAFRTATGVHAAAIIKAEKQGRRLAGRPHLQRRAGRHVRASSRRSRSATTRASRTSSTGSRSAATSRRPTWSPRCSRPPSAATGSCPTTRWSSSSRSTRPQGAEKRRWRFEVTLPRARARARVGRSGAARPCSGSQRVLGAGGDEHEVVGRALLDAGGHGLVGGAGDAAAQPTAAGRDEQRVVGADHELAVRQLLLGAVIPRDQAAVAVPARGDGA
jgi:2-isopropylmalate synthase